MKENRGSSCGKAKQQQLQQQKASSLLLDSFQVLPLAVGMAASARYEAVLNGGLLPIAYSARPLPRRFVRRAAKTAAVSEAARKKLKLDDDTTTTTTMMMIQLSETKKEKNVVCGENVKNYWMRCARSWRRR